MGQICSILTCALLFLITSGISKRQHNENNPEKQLYNQNATADDHAMKQNTANTLTGKGINDEHCLQSRNLPESNKIDVFYINLDRSIDRRKFMENQLKFYKLNHTNRIRAVTIRDVVIPHEISAQKDCLTASNLTIAYLTSSKLFNFGNSAYYGNSGGPGISGVGTPGNSFEKFRTFFEVSRSIPSTAATSATSAGAGSNSTDPSTPSVSLISSIASTLSSAATTSIAATATATTAAATISSPSSSSSSSSSPYKIVITELCGRPKNSRRELIVTISHLIAIKTAINAVSSPPKRENIKNIKNIKNIDTIKAVDSISTPISSHTTATTTTKDTTTTTATKDTTDTTDSTTTTTTTADSPYALILEDDTQIAFETDFLALAESAPKGFGILQLVTSNDYDVKSLLKDYTRDNRCEGCAGVGKTDLGP